MNDVRTKASIQLMHWLHQTVREAEGTWPKAVVNLRRGQWVRFWGDPGVVQGPARRGWYGQVLTTRPLRVLFVRQRRLSGMRPEALEVVAAPPPGYPRDGMRKFERAARALMRRHGDD
jgi:hypothetical protein